MDTNKTINEQQNEPGKVIYIVNPAGAVHACNRDHARARLKQKGYRVATAEQVAELERRQGHQVADNPIGPKA